ncbi:DUF6279 family lipoprotein [Pseudohalioglobus lutimaris]|uniref:Lipoprotein n=1 Tax=Pseudohalioglobus lutimaris TaxID=1737061 RepID=A0A2N5X8M3_9GAMM|nr:DUF6279 family lipoprotein [Pseudohalioglobus lutimaris]PLW70841.1 hypothetical protein C0039_01555 [Pseudohalioglobus lutimaris]
MTTRYRRSILGLLLLALTGCSSTTFLYNRLDFIIPWYVDDYVDLDRAQKRVLDRLLDPFLSWHRSEELPVYLSLLDDMDNLLDRDISVTELETLVAGAEKAWLRVEARGLEWMISLGEELSAEQMQEFVEELRDKQEEYEEEYLTRSDEEYHEEAYDNLKDSAQDYLGRLDWGQRTTFEEAADKLQRFDAIWLRERAAWLDRMEEILRREPGWQQALRDALGEREQTTSAEYRVIYEHNARVLYAAVATVLNSRDAKQDKRLRGKIRNLREDLEELIART